jgi:predicted RNA methylase
VSHEPHEKLTQITLSRDLSSLITRIPLRNGDWDEVRRSPVHSLLFDSFPALSSGQTAGIAVSFGNLRIRWRPDGGTYQLNLDAFRFISTVSPKIKDGARVIDIGTGSGVLGLGIAAHTRASRVCLVDYNPAAMKQAQSNCATLRRNGTVQPSLRLVQSKFHPSLAASLGEQDVLVSNPPYFPTDYLVSGEHSTRLTDDFGLTETLIHSGLDVAPEVYFSYSSTAEEEVAAMVAAAGLTQHASTAASWLAPFPAHLLSEKGRHKFHRNGPDPRWDAWHEVRIMRMAH